MKKIIVFSVLLFQFSTVFGQNTEWGSWSPVSCYSRLSTSVLGNGYVPSIKEYSWQIRIKSTYSKKVTFNMTWIVGGERLSIGQVTLSPNESYGHTPRYFKSSSNNIIVEVSEVCFEGQDCYKNGYADCNGNQTKITNNTNSTNNSTQQPQNNPTFDRNNASYQEYYKRATEAGQAGNYDEAINLWNSAISVAVNEAQRDNARAWLAEVQKAKANGVNSNIQQQQEQQKQQQENANRNAEIVRQKELLRQETEKQKAIEEVGGILQNSAVSITQSSLIDLQNTIKLEQELRNKLVGNEKIYPEAVNYFNDYLNAKKKRKRLGNIGLGIMGAGVVAVGVATLSINDDGEFNEGLMYGGIGATVAGLGMTIFTIGPSSKEKESLQKAKSYVALNINSKGIGLALNF